MNWNYALDRGQAVRLAVRDADAANPMHRPAARHPHAMAHTYCRHPKQQHMWIAACSALAERAAVSAAVETAGRFCRAR